MKRFARISAIVFRSLESAPTHAAIIGDVDALTEIYNLTLSSLLDQHAPPTDVTFRERR